MSYPYRVDGIVWAAPSPTLPSDAIVMLSKHLVLSGVEDHEPQSFHDAFEELDEDDQDDFWEDYEGSDEAHAAMDAEWEQAVKDELEVQHGVKVLSFGSYAPAPTQEEPVKVSVHFADEVQ